MIKRPMALTDPTDWISYPLLATNGGYRRQLLIINGDANWCTAQASVIVASLPEHLKCCWVGEYEPQQTLTYRSYAHFRDLLGEEFDVAVIDAGGTFRPSVLAAVTGTVRQGGTTILLCPDLDSWPTHDSVLTPHFLSYGATIVKSYYVEYVARLLSKADFAGLLSQSGMRLPKPESAIHRFPGRELKLTAEQEKVFNAVVSEQTSGEASCIVAARGRGKSTLTAFIAAHFIRRGFRVLLTAPSSQSVSTLENVANHLLKEDSASLPWMALDNPRLKEADYDVLIIDEAASVPLPVLNELVCAATFTLLSTTTDGYEGSGQGFRTKFLSKMNIPVHSLNTALRWSEDDPVEQLVQAISFSTPPVGELSRYISGSPSPIVKAQLASEGNNYQYKSCAVSTMLEDEISQVMQLLSSAHYQSSPDDLARLMDFPDTRFHLLSENENIIAASAVESEGGDKLSNVAQGISSGVRRVKGHLTAQSLALQSANPKLATLTYRRINRIAVQPHLQGNGAGSELLKKIKDYYQNEKSVDLLTSSFGADNNLVNFWSHAGFVVLKRGRKPDKASGLTSALVAFPVSEAATKYVVGMLKSETDSNSDSVRHLHLTRLRQFAEGSRSLDHLYSSSQWTQNQCQDGQLCHCLRLHEENVNPAEVARACGYHGKKAMVLDCRRRVSEWLIRLQNR